ncbi:hypothetical protein [Roseivirga sp. E12]|uniref:hypothetical protein n=1 Tax=Roseivirga sp. E12 TaxID=2819237 RepID=UPI001ABD240E|nr:hypothetical protein [Roseivirga sp. E12]MBO3697206.1 hypothetical protein [Roseivirga sp. E12]
MKKPLILLISGFSVIILLSLTLRPVPSLPENELTIANGIVSNIYEGGENDIVFKLRESNDMFYINRGLEQGLNIDDLKKRLLGNQITVKYPEYWSLLSNGTSHHISKVEYKGEVVFSELKH